MTLAKEEKEVIVQYRLERAVETLAEAKDLINLSRWYGAANRLYYACYYAVSGLLIKNGYTARTHSGVLGLFGKHFVLTKIISREQNKLYSTLFDLRQGGDYNDWIIIEEEDIVPLIEPVEEFIEKIENLINDN